MVDVVTSLGRVRVIPVLSVNDIDVAERACEALVAGGLNCVEITFRTDVAADAICRAAEIDGLLVGAGTILTPDQARAARGAGAAFAVAPGLNEEIVATCAELGLPFFPGIATPSELDRARALGCHDVKVFPISTLGGPAFLKSLSAVYRDVRFLPTGGVTRSNLAEYLAVPAVLACGGSWLCDGRLLAEGRYDEVERLAREAVEEVTR
ncbi:MAG: bifunctional 4-hydroxy-2-oxoglutarate aldolase/2-dehydro-3-deoxy-phosphogluconate aldolase [Gaiellaceae bacterium]